MEPERRIERRKDPNGYKSFFDDSTDGLFRVTIEGKFIIVNQAMSDLWGYESPQEMIDSVYDMSIQHYVDPEDRKNYQSLMLKIGRADRFEFQGKKKDGTIFWCMVNSITIYDENFVPRYYEGRGRDVTRIRQKELALFESESKFRNLFEHANDAILVVDRNNFVECNEKALELYGCTKDQIIGRSPLDFSLPEQPTGEFSDKGINYHLSEAYSGNAQFFQWQHVKYDKTPFIAEVSLNKFIANKNCYILAVVRDITEKYALQEQIKENEKKFKRLADNMYDLVVEVDLTGKRTYVSPSHKLIFGIEPSELLGDSCLSRIHPDDMNEAKEAFERALVTMMSQNVCCRQQISNGNYIWIESHGSPVFDEDGILVSGVIVSRDITAKKEADDNLIASENRYKELYNQTRLMCDTVPDMIWAKDMQRRFTFVNKAVCEKLLLAKDTDEPVGKTDMFFVERARAEHSDNPNWHTFGEICLDSDQVIIDTALPGRFDEFGNVKGEFLCLDVSKAPIIVDGKMIGTVGCGKDVTEYKKVENALAVSEAKYRAIVEDQTELICRFTPDFIVTFVNQAYCDYFDVTCENLIGCKFMNLIHDNDKDFVKNSINSITIDKPVNRYDYEFIDHDGETHWMQWSDRAIFDDQNNVKEYQSIGFDITDRKRLEQKLEQAKIKYRSILDTLQDGFYQTDQQGNISFVSQSAVSILGYSERSEIIGTPIKNHFFDLADQKMFFQRLKDNGGKLANHEVRLKNKKGQLIIISLNIQIIYNSNNVIIGTQGTFRDITEIKQRLLEIEKLYNVVEGSQSGLIVTELNGTITYANQAVLEISRSSKAIDIEKYIVGENIKSIISFDDFCDFSEVCQIIEKEGKWFGAAYVSYNKQEKVPIDVMFSKIHDDENQLYIVASFNDTSERFELEKKIQDQSQMYEELYSSMMIIVNKMDSIDNDRKERIYKLEQRFTESVNDMKSMGSGGADIDDTTL